MIKYRSLVLKCPPLLAAQEDNIFMKIRQGKAAFFFQPNVAFKRKRKDLWDYLLFSFS
jgi:hypothetical protein